MSPETYSLNILQIPNFWSFYVSPVLQVWNEGTAGTEGGIRLYLREIIPLLTSALESPQWRFV